VLIQPGIFMETKQKQISLSLTIAIVIAAVILTFFGTFSLTYLRYAASDSYKGPGAAALKQMHHHYTKHYNGEIDLDLLERSIIDGYIAGTGDKYANYLSHEEYLAYFGSEDGTKVGIGIQIVVDETVTYVASDEKTYVGGLYITSIVPDSGAEKAGLKAGDVIIEAEGLIIGKDGVQKVYYSLGGAEGDKKELTVLRGVEYSVCEDCGSLIVDTSNAQKITVTVTISILATQEVTYRVYDANTGIIKIDSFMPGSYEQFEKAINELIEEGVKNIVFDLRDNPGGDLNEVTKMLDLLLPKNKLLATLVDRNGKKTEYYSKEEDKINFERYNFAVLVNENSASAAELFTAALRDYEMATIVGTKTYGKGVAQSVFPILIGESYGYFSVTTSKYNPPSGVNFDGEGVYPTDGYYVELDPGIDLGNVEDINDNQLQKALTAFK